MKGENVRNKGKYAYSGVSMFETFKLVCKNKTLRKRIFFTVLVLLIMRVFYSIPTPGVNSDYFKLLLDSIGTLGMLNMLSGNSLSELSLMTVGITPYITASIIIQLMGVIFPKIKELQQGMKDDREKLERATIVLGIILALVQGLGMSFGLGRKGLLVEYKWYWALLVGVIWAIFSGLISIVGNIMTDKREYFVGNGVSLILFTNIVSSFISDFAVMFVMFVKGKKVAFMLLNILWIVCLVFAIVILTVYLQESEKKIRVVYSVKSGAIAKSGTITNTIPLKLCQGGVAPIIFASSLFGAPVMIAALFGKMDNVVINFLNTNMWFRISSPWYTLGALIYIGLIFAFSYFYSDIVFNPAEVADNIRKHGGNIAGIRQGKPTELYLRKQSKILIAIGAGCLSVLSVIPIALGGLLGVPQLSFMGTSIIVVVGVVIETGKTIKMETRETFYSKKKGGIFGGKAKSRA